MTVEVVGTADFFFQIVVFVVFQLLAALLYQVGDVFGGIAEFAFLNSVQGVEIVVDMFQTRFAETGDAVHQFAGEVIALVIIESFIEYGVVVKTAHGYGSCALHLFDKLLLELRGTHGTAQSAEVLVQEGGDGEFEVRFCVFQYFGELFAGVLAHQLEGFFGVGGLHKLFQGFVALGFRFAFLVHHLATYQDEYSEGDKGDNGDVATVVEHEGDEETDGEGCSGGDEPATDDTKYAGDAVDGGVASPGTVGKRGTHGYHEGDVGSGEGKFQ